MATRSASPPAAKPATAPARAAAIVLGAATSLRAELAAGTLRPVYVVTSGDDPARNRRAERPVADPAALLAVAAEIELAALAKGDRALDYAKVDYLDGDHLAIGVHNVIAGELRAQSLFGGRRVVTVVHAEGLVFGDGKAKGKKAKGGEGDDPIEAVLATLSAGDRAPPFVLIVVAEQIDPAARAWAALAAAGAIVEVPPLTAAALQAYLDHTAAPFRIRVQPPVAQRIWDRLGGSDAARLRSTADRLILDAGPGGHITVAMVEESVPMDREAAVFAITDAIADQDLIRALTVLRMILDHAGPAARDGQVILLVGWLASHYIALAQVAEYVARGADVAEIARLTGMHEFRAGSLARQARASRPGRIALALRTVAELDLAHRSTRLGDRSESALRWLEQAVTALVRGVPLRRQRDPRISSAL